MAVPALRKGLRILEMAVEEGGVRFSRVQEAFGFQKASAARFLNELVELEYLAKKETSGRYRIGPRVGRLAPYVPLRDRMCRVSAEPMRVLADSTGNTVLLIHWDGARTQALAKEMRSESVVMQEVGSVRADLLFYPWGWLFFWTLPREEQEAQRRDAGKPAAWFRRIEKERRALPGKGYVFEDEGGRAGFSRLAAPITLPDGEIVGALAMGGTPVGLSRRRVGPCGRQLADAAREIAEALVSAAP
jgi:DNA-binding IclR family transcriptional regulator